jgi:hypothetical protein
MRIIFNSLSEADFSKEAVVSILGASVSLGGLLLIFSGFLFSQAATLPSTTPDRIIERFKTAGRAGMYPFIACLVLAGISTFCLLMPSSTLFWLCIVGFGILLVGTAVYGSIVIWYL